MSEAYIVRESRNQFGTAFWDVAVTAPSLKACLPPVAHDPVGNFPRVVENPADLQAWGTWIFEFRRRVGGNDVLGIVLAQRLQILRVGGAPPIISRSRFYLELPVHSEGHHCHELLFLNIDPHSAFRFDFEWDKDGTRRFLSGPPREELYFSLEAPRRQKLLAA